MEPTPQPPRPLRKPPRKPNRDWYALEGQFQEFKGTLFAFAQSVGIPIATLWRVAKARNWEYRRESVQARALANATSHTIAGETHKYIAGIKNALAGLEAIAENFRKAQARGVTLAPKEVASLMESNDKAIKTLRLILGDSTENVETRPNYHKQAADIIAALESEGILEAEVVPDTGNPGEIPEDGGNKAVAS